MTEIFDPAAHLTIFHDAIDRLDYEMIERYFADDAIYISGGVGGRIDGREAIMAAFRKYFETYPDQKARNTLVEQVGPRAARSVWTLSATDSRTGEPMVRNGEETLIFNEEGRIIRIDVTDY